MDSSVPAFEDLDYLFLKKGPLCPDEFEPDAGVSLKPQSAEGNAIRAGACVGGGCGRTGM